MQIRQRINAKLKLIQIILLSETQKLHKDVFQNLKLKDQSNLISKLLKKLSKSKMQTDCETYASATK